MSGNESSSTVHSNIRSAMRRALIMAGVVAVLSAAVHLYRGGNWIGPDNDDVMRAVQVRDLLGGQNWFDVAQYRLGLDGGTRMHWSRLVDAPIAGLELAFSVLLAPSAAEKVAVYIWPLILIVPLMLAIAVAARRLGGEPAVIPSLVMGGFLVFTIQKFMPGAIDHHNVQMTLIAIVLAGILDRGFSVRSFSVAGLAAALALAIGAEVAPLVAVGSGVVALLWLVYGPAARHAAVSYGVAFSSALTLAFVFTVAPSDYGSSYCDAFSGVFFRLGLLGSGGLVLMAALVRGTAARIGAVVVLGALLVTAAITIAPQCLQNPLNELDPVLAEVWLQQVQEAQSFTATARSRPHALGFFYAVPVLALVVSGVLAWKRKGSVQLAAIALLVATALAVSLVQVRGSYFTMLVVIPPMAWFVSIMRKRGTARSASRLDAALYLLSAFASLPVFWAVLGMPFDRGIRANEVTSADSMETCAAPGAYEELADLPAGVVAGVSNLGAEILAYTPHRALSAPYHRNQDGMLAAYRILTSPPDEAIDHLESSATSWVVVCSSDPETRNLIRRAPGGLLANLVEGRVPAYLAAVDTGNAIDLYAVIR